MTLDFMVKSPVVLGMSDNEKGPKNAGRSLEEPVVSGLVVLASQGKSCSFNIQDGFTSARNNTDQQNHPQQESNHDDHHHHLQQNQGDKPQQELNPALSGLSNIKKLPYQLFHSLSAQKVNNVLFI